MSVIHATDTFSQLGACRVVAISNQSGTYFNGLTNNGVGATFTYATGALTIDDVVVNINDRVLLKGQTLGYQNGIYQCIVQGATGVTAILQRVGDFQCIEQMKLGAFLYITAGTENAGAGFVLVEPLPASIGVPITSGANDILFTASPLNTGFGTAAEKDASDDAQPTVASVSGATVLNQILVAADTVGTIKSSSGLTAISGAGLRATGSIQAGLSGTAGIVTSYPATATTGSLGLTAVANSGDYFNQISNTSTGQATTWRISDPAGSVGYLNASLINASLTPVGAFITQTVTLAASSLASAGQVVIQAGSGSMRFKIRDIKVNYTASGLSGGGGNRLIQITDGTTVYNNAGITAALAGTPVNTVWGGSGNPLPGNVSADTPSVAGTSVYAVYAGGTTDYTAGSISVTVSLERTA